jgi:hypothetical protein
VTLDDWNDFLARMKRSKDLDEKALFRHLNDNVLPSLLEEEKEREKQRLIREQEYLKAQAFAARKRSTRLVQKEEDKKFQAEREVELAKLQAEEEERKKEQLRLKKLEQEREARLVLREQRQRERELRIQQREDEKRRMTEEAEQIGTPIKITIKTSVSPAPAKKTPRQQALDEQRGIVDVEPSKPEESWFFDCICGKHGTNYDDGTYTVACEMCDIWQHVDCLPNPKDREELIKRKDAPEGEYPDYEFICSRCRKKAKEEAKADAVKSKEQLRKEKERAANRAKYERRKAREKARKEEERRKREEEVRLGITTLPDGTVIQTPPVVNGPISSSSPNAISPEHRIPTSTIPMSQAARYPYPPQITPSSHSAMLHDALPYANTMARPGPPPQFIHYPYQSPIPQPHQVQATPTQTVPNPSPSQQSNASTSSTPSQHPRPPYNHIPYQLPQHASASQLHRFNPYPSNPPAAPPYWSPYTTGQNLPNGQRFPQNPPQHTPPQSSPPYQNGTSPSVPSLPRTIAIKPAPNPIPPTTPSASISAAPSQTKPSPSSHQPPPQTLQPPQQQPPQPSQQQRTSQSPVNIQPRPSKSPELRKSPQSMMPINQPLAPRPSPNIASAPSPPHPVPFPPKSSVSDETGRSTPTPPLNNRGFQVQLLEMENENLKRRGVDNGISSHHVEENGKSNHDQENGNNNESDKGNERINLAFLVN